MHHPEAVGDESPSGRDQFGEFAGECEPLAVVLAGFPRIEADVLQQQDVAVGEPFGPGQRVAADDIAGQLHVPAELLTERRGDRRQRQLRVGPVFRPTQVRGDHHLGAGVDKRLQRRHRGGDPARVGDDALVVERDVQVGAHQHAPPRNTFGQQVFQRWNCHDYSDLPTSATRSMRRLE